MSQFLRENIEHQPLKEIDEWCDDVFGWLGRPMVGSAVAPIAARFDALVDAHFGTNRSAGRLEVWRSLSREGAPELISRFEDGFYKRLPIPHTEPPDNLIGFKSICIRYIDDTTVAFLHRSRRLFQRTDIALKMCIRPQSTRAWSIMAQHIWPLVAANVSRMWLESYVLTCLRQYVSPSVLCDCANLRQIESEGIFPEAPTDDDDSDNDSNLPPRDASNAHALGQWLHSPRADGRPKLLHVEAWTEGQHRERIAQLKRAFLAASLPVSYAIRLTVYVYGPYEPFEVDNTKTRERLTFCRIDKRSDALWLLKRAPTDDQSTKVDDDWTWTNGGGVFRVQFEDRDIGPLSACDGLDWTDALASPVGNSLS